MRAPANKQAGNEKLKGNQKSKINKIK